MVDAGFVGLEGGGVRGEAFAGEPGRIVGGLLGFGGGAVGDLWTQGSEYFSGVADARDAYSQGMNIAFQQQPYLAQDPEYALGLALEATQVEP